MTSIEVLVPLIKESLSNDKDFIMPIKGTSMLPLLNETMTVSLTKVVKLKKNDIIFYLRDDGNYVLHRIHNVNKNNTYNLVGDNQIVLEKGIREDQIIGVVNHIYLKDKKEIKMSGFKYNSYLFFRHNLFLRRILIKLGRKNHG